MSGITTHVLDTSRGKPARGIEVSLEFREPDDRWRTLGTSVTNSDGRVGDLWNPAELERGLYRLTFMTRPYFRRLGVDAFYPQVQIQFEIASSESHFHVPLLLNPFGYTTYRGS